PVAANRGDAQEPVTQTAAGQEGPYHPQSRPQEERNQLHRPEDLSHILHLVQRFRLQLRRPAELPRVGSPLPSPKLFETDRLLRLLLPVGSGSVLIIIAAPLDTRVQPPLSTLDVVLQLAAQFLIFFQGGN